MDKGRAHPRLDQEPAQEAQCLYVLHRVAYNSSITYGRHQQIRHEAGASKFTHLFPPVGKCGQLVMSPALLGRPPRGTESPTAEWLPELGDLGSPSHGTEDLAVDE